MVAEAPQQPIHSERTTGGSPLRARASGVSSLHPTQLPRLEEGKRHGGFVPGIRPGKATEQYFDYLLNRITVVGAAYLVFICLVPDILSSQAGLTLRLGGTSLLIVVNVTMDTVSQIQSHLIAHQYGDLIKKAKLKTTPRRR